MSELPGRIRGAVHAAVPHDSAVAHVVGRIERKQKGLRTLFRLIGQEQTLS
jgi:hypothetical protein